MQTLKDRFSKNLTNGSTFEYFSIEGYRVYSEPSNHNEIKISFYYIHPKTKRKTRIEKDKDKVICPQCETDNYLKIQHFNGRNSRYICKNPLCNKKSFKYHPKIYTYHRKTLTYILKDIFNINSIKAHQEAYKKYAKIKKSGKRIIIENEDIQYLEHYLLLGLPRDIIANLFSISEKTLQRFIKNEEEKNKSRFQKDVPFDLVVIDQVDRKENPFYTIIDYHLEPYEEIINFHYYKKEKCNKIVKKK